MSPIEFGILSFAHHHAHAWARGINDSKHARLAGIWDDDPARGQEAAGQHECELFDHLDALLSRCHAVGITSETNRHADLIERAAAAGVHVICEKPLAFTRADCDRISKAVADSGISFMQNFPKRYDPASRELVELAHTGGLGEVTLVRMRHANFHLLNGSAAGTWFTDPDRSGPGALLDEGVHGTDFLAWLLGPASSVQAATASSATGLPIDDTAIAVYSFPGGGLADLATGGAMLAGDAAVEVFGTEGAATLHGVDLTSVEFARPPYLRVYRAGTRRGRWEARPINPGFRKPTYHAQGPRQFVSCLTSGINPTPTLDDGRRAVEMVLAAYESAATGQSVSIAPPWGAQP